MLEYIWLIPLFPALGAAFQLFFGRRVSNKIVSLVSVGLPGLAFVWALGCVSALFGQPEHTFAKTLDALGADQIEDAKGVKHDWRKELFEAIRKRHHRFEEFKWTKISASTVDC